MLPLTGFVGVRVQQEPTRFLQIPLATLQKLFTLSSGAQAESEQLLHLQQAGDERVRLFIHLVMLLVNLHLKIRVVIRACCQVQTCLKASWVIKGWCISGTFR